MREKGGGQGKSIPRTCFTQMAIINAIKIWEGERERRRKGLIYDVTPLPDLAELAMEEAARQLCGPMVEG